MTICVEQLVMKYCITIQQQFNSNVNQKHSVEKKIK